MVAIVLAVIEATMVVGVVVVRVVKVKETTTRNDE